MRGSWEDLDINGKTVLQQYRQYTYKRNTEARLLNRCCRGKAISIAYSESVFVALVIQHARRLRRTILSSVACLAVPFFLWRCDPPRVMASSFLMFLDHTQRRITVGRAPLGERSARRRDLYLTKHNNHNRQTSMPPGGIRTHDLSRRVAADLRLRPRGHWDRQKQNTLL